MMKTVIVLEPLQPLGLLINTAAVLSVTLGDVIENIRGEDTLDSDGMKHPGVIRIPLPILQADSQTLMALWDKANSDSDMFVADFTQTAQSCKTYDEYVEKCSAVSTNAMGLLGIAIYGPKKKVNKLIGSLKALR